jgi:carboxyl-terminal processing protease
MISTIDPEVKKVNASTRRFGRLVFIVVISILAGFTIGYALAIHSLGGSSGIAALQDRLGITPNSKTVLNQTLDAIHSEYVNQPVSDSKLFYGALEGMIQSLDDPYSSFFTPEAAKAFKNDLDLSIEGIGAEIGYKGKLLAIIAPLPKSPAEKAGIKAGDLIISIDGVDASTLTLDTAVEKIRGAAGTSVKISIYRGDEEKTFTITRAKIVLDSVIFKQYPNNIAYIQIVSFNDQTTAQFDAIIQALLLQSEKGIILDLRNNPGGILDVAVEVSGEFIGKTVVVREKDAKGNERQDKSDRTARVPNMPLIVLVNNGSASASEIVAGALQDAKRATVLGTTTFGKGSVQSLQNLPDGSQLKITIAKWYTPNGRSIDKLGITPDVKVADPTESGETKDTQLQKALSILEKK